MNKNGMPDEAQLTLTGAPELLGFSPTENDRNAGLQRISALKSSLTASLTKSVREVFLPVLTVRRSASRSRAAISSGGRYTVTGLSLLLPLGGLPRVAMQYPP